MFSWIWDGILNLIYRLLYYAEVGLLSILGFVERFFDLFAGTRRVTYGDQNTYLVNILLDNSAITTAFWAMALLAIVLSFFFAIVTVARKSVDFSEHIKQSTGQIMSSFFRGVLIILVLNFGVVASINITNVLLDRVNYAMLMAPISDGSDLEKDFTEKEYAQMATVLATVANFSAIPTADMRYNANACFNAVRADLLGLATGGVFDYDYPKDDNDHYCWQGALQLLASAADLNTELTLSEYNGEVINAITVIKNEMMWNKNFYPVSYVKRELSAAQDIKLDTLLFLVTSLGAERKSTGSPGLDDALRQSYLREDNPRDYKSYNQVTKDFALSKINFITAYIAAIVMIIVMSMVIFSFVVRMFNIAILYITAPFFASTMSADDGEKFKSWTQSFIIQLFSGFGSVIAMRLYLMFIPIIMSSKMRFFLGSSSYDRLSDSMAKLIAILAGGWAVLQAGGLISAVLSGSSAMQAAQQDGAMRAMATAGVLSAPGMALGAAKTAAGAAKSTAKGLYNAARAVSHPVDSLANVGRSIKQSWQSPNRQRRAAMTSERQRKMNDAETDARYAEFKNQQAGESGSAPRNDRSQAPEAGTAPHGQESAVSESGAVGGSAGKKTPRPVASGSSAQLSEDFVGAKSGTGGEKSTYKGFKDPGVGASEAGSFEDLRKSRSTGNQDRRMRNRNSGKNWENTNRLAVKFDKSTRSEGMQFSSSRAAATAEGHAQPRPSRVSLNSGLETLPEEANNDEILVDDD